MLGIYGGYVVGVLAAGLQGIICTRDREERRKNISDLEITEIVWRERGGKGRTEECESNCTCAGI